MVTQRPRVVIVGSGFGGLFCAQALKHVDVDVTIIAATTHHLFQPLLYQVATGILSEGEIAPATREVVARQENVTVLLGTVTHIDVTAMTVTSTLLDREYVTGYDYLVVAAGAGQSYFGNDRFARFAPGLKSIDDALELRGRIMGAFELAERAATEEEVRRLLTFVVVGAGPTGVEVVGQIAELARRTLPRDFRRINTEKARIILAEGGDQVLPAFGKKLGVKTQRRLERLGVEVRLGTMVTDVEVDFVTLKDPDGTSERVESVSKVWAAGVSASPLGKVLAEQTGADVDRAGRIKVRTDLSLPDHPEIFCVGDMMSLDNLPGVAQVAIQQGRYAARAVGRMVTGQPPQDEFHYFDKGSLATIARFSGVAKIGRFESAGFIGWLLYMTVHLFYIIGFKSRITTLLHWTVAFIGRGRAERTTTTQQVMGRLALEEVDDRAVALLIAGPPPPDERPSRPDGIPASP